MKFSIQIAAAIAAGALSFMAEAVPLDQRDVEVREYKDGLDYDRWVAREVDEGRLFWANDTTPIEIRDLEGRGITATIRNVACEHVLGDQPSFELAKDWWCDWADTIEKEIVEDAKAYVTDTICGGRACRLYMEMKWKKWGTFEAGAFKSGCIQIMDSLYYKKCQGGGTGGLQMTDNGKTWEGTVTIKWLQDHEAMQTCPVPSVLKPNEMCAARVHN
ncbi:hypothetical protein F4819DRAFT_483594 [Hypoxylon fuscum]|nr:hypothetical protein F4819DRAFT_483594 [Hypoxylon fuscum]